jgi:hypothetical protein
MDPKMKPVKKPFINKPTHQRTPNSASPVGSPTPSGNFLNSDKDYSKHSGAGPAEVASFHNRDDIDVSFKSHHHTLGPGHNQASPGDHRHDGKTSKLIGAGDGNILTGAKGGNVALTNLIALVSKYIEFTDGTT